MKLETCYLWDQLFKLWHVNHSSIFSLTLKKKSQLTKIKEKQKVKENNALHFAKRLRASMSGWALPFSQPFSYYMSTKLSHCWLINLNPHFFPHDLLILIRFLQPTFLKLSFKPKWIKRKKIELSNSYYWGYS